jgi:6,7-dimethyl-8-ribityllumazine synthase
MRQELSQPPAPHLNGAGLKIGIVVARFNWHITGAMLYEARRTLHHLEVADEDIAVYYTP